MRMSKTQLKKYRNWLAVEHPICQDENCNKMAVDSHHLIFGCYGAEKDDTMQITLCREHHEWCHKNKHESQKKYGKIAENNYKEYKCY